MKTRQDKPKYLKIVEWSDEDGCFVGSAPPLIGPCCHGMDEAKVFRELGRIVNEWIEIFQKDGRPLPPSIAGKKYSGKFMVRVDPGLHQKLALKAEAKGESLNQFVTRALGKA
ncbi:MAG TPA: toxin-antitoxin system HicB family antitoxin [Verrucomicrobiae bacterium]|nr:toxin-antitoxin system HicB family antitoxin [Verrucomicrobiae bacterium]